MLRTLKDLSRRDRLNFFVLLPLLAVLLFFGGASRADALSQPVVRLAAILALTICALQSKDVEWQRGRPLFLFLAAIGIVIGLQLIPLPPEIWRTLPGREVYKAALEAVDADQVWRPLSLTPDLTLNSLLALLPPIAVVTLLVTIHIRLSTYLVTIILIGVAISSLIGLMQITGGFYFYEVTNDDSGVGVFANRNHQAVFLATALPLLACWSTSPSPNEDYGRLRNWVSLCMGAIIFPLLLVTGSRAGVALGVIGAFFAAGIVLKRYDLRRFWRRSSLLLIGPVVIGIVSIAALAGMSRGLALARLIHPQESELRIEYLPIYIEMAGDFLPWGSGFGSFDTVFRIYEPHSALGPRYLNHAHNDFMQIVIEAGIFGLIPMLAFLAWFAARAWKGWRAPLRNERSLLSMTGAAIASLILLSSLVDYPLRTPLLAALMTIACFWLSSPSSDRSRDPQSNGKDRLGSTRELR